MDQKYILELRNPDGKVLKTWTMDMAEHGGCYDIPLDTEDFLQPVYDDDFERSQNNESVCNKKGL